MLRPSALPGAQPAAVLSSELTQEELAGLYGGGKPLLVVGGGRRLGERRQEECVPLGEDLVVEPGSDPFLAGLEQPLSRPFDVRQAHEVAPDRTVEDVGALEVAGLGDAPPLEGDRRFVGAEDVFDLVRAPDVELALFAL